MLSLTRDAIVHATEHRASAIDSVNDGAESPQAPPFALARYVSVLERRNDEEL